MDGTGVKKFVTAKIQGCKKSNSKTHFSTATALSLRFQLDAEKTCELAQKIETHRNEILRASRAKIHLVVKDLGDLFLAWTSFRSS